jgi:uncharacterized membrane protein
VTVGVTDPPEPSGAPRGRVTSIDALRGIVMILMALDHVRDFVHHEAMVASPTDLARTTPLLFLTRWVTHFCAPVFIMTAGLGAWFWWRRGRSRSQLAGFLLTRGMWLVLLELTVMRLAYNFSVSLEYPVFLLVLWVLGACMIGLALLVWVPPRVMMIAALATIALHNLLDPIAARDLGGAAAVWNLLHQAGAFRLGQLTVIVGYPLLPWIAVMALGFASGPLFRLAPAERQRILVTAGAAATIGFTALRAWNGYGDPAPWQPQPSPVFTALSFLNTTKYPPSLIFLLMTLGPALIALAWLDRRGLNSWHPLVVLGRAPLFYFVAHFFLAHLAAALLALGRYGGAAWSFIFHPLPSMGGPRPLYPESFGYDLWVVYVVWAAIVLALYPACRRVAAWKAGRTEWWVGHL